MTHKTLFIKTGKFLKDESNKIMLKLAQAKDKKTFNQASRELNAIKRRISIEIEMLEKFFENND